ncbi:MAG: serine hydroxymethyltransferase [Planctomycetota bacterium]|jgi:glycine hydroxymethyltransferase
MDTLQELREISRLCRANDAWRSETVNLIASENVLSEATRRLLDSDFHHRYAEGHPGARYYEGTRYIDEVEQRTARLVAEIFKADCVDVRLPSGTMANEAAFSALLKKGGVALAHGVAGGGHISHARFGALGKHADKILELPRCDDGYRLDAAAACDQIRRERPRLVVLGRSLFLFPEPVAEIKPACEEVGAVLLYDGSHVLGLIAAGAFQDPLREGADVLTASTHKTFFGPQRGIVLARGLDEEAWRPVDRAVFPGVTSNHHLFSLPALFAAALEIREFGAAYARAVVRNARALAASLHRRGFDVAAADLGYTASHQIAVDVGDHGGGRAVSRRLCDHGIITNMNLLPGEPGRNARNPRGIRLGVQEMTRFGMGEEEMDRIAGLIHACLVQGDPVAEECRRLRAEYPEVQYAFRRDQLEGQAVAPTAHA